MNSNRPKMKQIVAAQMISIRYISATAKVQYIP